MEAWDDVAVARKHKHPPMTTVERAELDEARVTLARGEAVRIVSGKRVILCSTLDEVRNAQRGVIPANAVRLDGTA